MTSNPRPAVAQVDDSRLAEAFRNLHGQRLHGFALLVALGDPDSAERAAGEALAAGAQQAAVLNHPERAAAWLRARVLRALHQSASRGVATPASVRRDALAPLGVESVLYEALADLSIEGRGALVASAIERFEPIDTETILSASPAAARRVVAQARTRYLRAVEGQPVAQPDAAPSKSEGVLATLVRDAAARAMSTEWKSR